MEEEELENLEYNIYEDIIEDANNGDEIASSKMVAIQIGNFYQTLLEEGVGENLAYELTFMFASQLMGVEDDGIPF
jgi:hypothetical protein